MSKVIDHPTVREIRREVGGGPRPPDNGSTELNERVANLERDGRDVRERLSRIEVRLEGMPTKADLSETKAELIKWIVGTVLGLGATGITVLTFVLNQAVPKTTSSSTLAPIVITVPVPTAHQPASATGRP